jgi:outer membrane protein assembly factor BamB
MKRTAFSILAFAWMFSAATPAATNGDSSKANWPRWRGPLANGVAPLAEPPLKWSESENVKWKLTIPGFGTSTPIIWEDQVFILTAIPTGKKADSSPPAAVASPPNLPDQPPGQAPGSLARPEQPNESYQFVVLAVDRTTGKIRWQKTAREQVPHEGHHRDHGFASASPVTDGEHLFVHFGSRGLYCYDLNGTLKWEKDLGDMQTRNGFGEGSSPALHGEIIVVLWDHEGDDFIVALDKRTGEERWRQKRDEPTTWSTPLIVEHDGKAQVIATATNKIRSYDLSTGQPLWECGGMTTNVIPTAVSDFGMVYATSGYRGSALLAIRLGRTGDLTGTDAIAWEHHKSTPYVSSPLLLGERIYFFAGNNGTLSCFDAKTGKAHFEAERIADLLGGVYGSPVGANGRVYLTGRDGKFVVIKDADRLEILASNKLDDRFDASPAAVGKQLFLRGHQSLYCVAE